MQLSNDHPGVADSNYLARRAAIAAIAEKYQDGIIPAVAYTEVENQTWRTVAHELADVHAEVASAELRAAATRLALPTDRVPQLAEISARLGVLSNFRVEPVPGLVPTRRFYGALADRCFLSTQYLRHHSVPLYTPEPDVIHEVMGHATLLASPAFADLHQAAGKASLRSETAAALDFFSRIFWFTLEFGVIREGAATKAYGAGLLSSFGELAHMHHADIRPFDLVAMGTQDYDITVYQPVLFAAASMAQLTDELGDFFESYDDEAYGRLTSGPA